MGKLKIVKDGKGKSLPSDLYPHQARIPTSVHPLMLEFLRSKMTSSDDPFFHSSSAGYLSYHKVGWDNLYSGDYDTDHHMLTCGATIPDDTNIYEATKFEFAGTFAPQNENAIIFAYSGNGAGITCSCGKVKNAVAVYEGDFGTVLKQLLSLSGVSVSFDGQVFL